MPGARTTTHPDSARSAWTAMAILAVAVMLMGALFVGTVVGVIPRSPTFAGQVPGQEYVSSQARGNAFSLP